MLGSYAAVGDDSRKENGHDGPLYQEVVATAIAAAVATSTEQLLFAFADQQPSIVNGVASWAPACSRDTTSVL